MAAPAENRVGPDQRALGATVTRVNVGDRVVEVRVRGPGSRGQDQPKEREDNATGEHCCSLARHSRMTGKSEKRAQVDIGTGGSEGKAMRIFSSQSIVALFVASYQTVFCLSHNRCASFSRREGKLRTQSHHILR